MIKACICTYNDDATLGLTLASITGYIDEIIAIDGPWKNYSDNMSSTDGTLEILESYNAKILTGRWESQVQKRNAYIKACNNNDWILVIDSDELLWNGYWLNFVEEYSYPIWSVPIYSINYPANLYPGANKAGLLEYTPKNNRLFKKNINTHYWLKHFYLMYDGWNNSWLSYAPKCPLGIIHINFLRPDTRKEEKLNYYVKRENIKEEGRGHFGFWLYPNCWEDCHCFQEVGTFNNDMKCSSDFQGMCRAMPGRKDVTRGKKQIGPMIL